MKMLETGNTLYRDRQCSFRCVLTVNSVNSEDDAQTRELVSFIYAEKIRRSNIPNRRDIAWRQVQTVAWKDRSMTSWLEPVKHRSNRGQAWNAFRVAMTPGRCHRQSPGRRLEGAISYRYLHFILPTLSGFRMHLIRTNNINDTSLERTYTPEGQGRLAIPIYLFMLRKACSAITPRTPQKIANKGKRWPSRSVMS